MCWYTCLWGLLTPQEVLTLLKTDSVRITFLGGSSAITMRHGHDGSSVPHQKLTQRTIITRCCAVQRSPVGQRSAVNGYIQANKLLLWRYHFTPPSQTQHPTFMVQVTQGEQEQREALWVKRKSHYLPAMAVWCTDVGSDADQEVYNIVMTSANSIMKGSDALIVGLARVIHLSKTFYRVHALALLCLYIHSWTIVLYCYITRKFFLCHI